MKIKVNKKIAIVLAVLILTLSIGSVAFAASGYKDLRAWYNNIKIFKNGKQVQLDFEPFIIDGYTYVPLRAVGELFNKDFDWDGVNYTINIKDRPDTGLNAMMVQIVEQQVTISNLEAKVKELEAELAKKPTVSSLSDLEKQLNKEFGRYARIDFEIDLYESKGKLEVRIYVDLDVDYNDWDDLSKRDIEDYVQDIVDYILDNYKDVTISGFIEDEPIREKLYSFTVSKTGSVSLSTKTTGYSDLDDLEYDLYDAYVDYYGIRDIELYDDGNYIDIILYVNKKDWDSSGSSNQRRVLKWIYEDIKYEYKNAYLFGEIVDYSTGKTLYNFDYDSSGNADIW